MSEDFDRATGEITVADPHMPPIIAKAIIQVKTAAKQIGFDEKNVHASYGYASVDKFYIAVRPLEAEAGLFVLTNEVGVTYREAGKNRDGNPIMWAMPVYDIWIYHETGEAWGPLRRHLALPITGPQAFGSAESYIQKALRRSLYMIPTGEKDADDIAPSDAPATLRGSPQAATRVNPAIAAKDPALEPTRRAYIALQQAIDTSEDREALREVYDAVLDLWGPAFDKEVRLIQETKPSALGLLKDRLHHRLQLIGGE